VQSIAIVGVNYCCSHLEDNQPYFEGKEKTSQQDQITWRKPRQRNKQGPRPHPKSQIAKFYHPTGRPSAKSPHPYPARPRIDQGKKRKKKLHPIDASREASHSTVCNLILVVSDFQMLLRI
jgi:hypothetical protein